jgi:hypothetical protein
LKWLSLLVALIVVVAGAGVASFYVRYPMVPPAETISIQSTPEKVERGKYLSNHVTGCVECLAERDFSKKHN